MISKVKNNFTNLRIYKEWRIHRRLANTAFNNALSPEMVGETVMDLFSFMQPNLDKPIDIFEVMQRITIEVLGKLAFGYKCGVSMWILFYLCYYLHFSNQTTLIFSV